MVKSNYEEITNSDSFHKIDINVPLKITWEVTNQEEFNEAYAKYLTETSQISKDETQELELKISNIYDNVIHYDYTEHAGLENFFTFVLYHIGSQKIKFNTQPAFDNTTEITKVEAVLKKGGGGKRKNTKITPRRSRSIKNRKSKSKGKGKGKSRSPRRSRSRRSSKSKNKRV